VYHNLPNICYTIISKGPDRADSFWFNPDGSGTAHIKEYDPTNGTISWGDLHYWGPGNIPRGEVQNY